MRRDFRGHNPIVRGEGGVEEPNFKKRPTRPQAAVSRRLLRKARDWRKGARVSPCSGLYRVLLMCFGWVVPSTFDVLAGLYRVLFSFFSIQNPRVVTEYM